VRGRGRLVEVVESYGTQAGVTYAGRAAVVVEMARDTRWSGPQGRVAVVVTQQTGNT
jgi:hypothetical protein